MQCNIKVKVVELGKTETIDGITGVSTASSIKIIESTNGHAFGNV